MDTFFAGTSFAGASRFAAGAATVCAAGATGSAIFDLAGVGAFRDDGAASVVRVAAAGAAELVARDAAFGDACFAGAAFAGAGAFAVVGDAADPLALGFVAGTFGDAVLAAGTCGRAARFGAAFAPPSLPGAGFALTVRAAADFAAVATSAVRFGFDVMVFDDAAFVDGFTATCLFSGLFALVGEVFWRGGIVLSISSSDKAARG